MSQNDFSTSFTEYLKKYIQSNQQTDEFELRFGTNYSNKITRIDFDNVIKKLKLNNFTCESPNGQYHLNIQNEFLDERSGRLRMSNIRTEIKGLMNIKKYCLKNTFNLEIPEVYVSFLQKKKKVDTSNEAMNALDNNNYEFRVNYKTENTLTSNYPLVRNMLNEWNNTKKTFRLIKRFTFQSKEGFPFKVDLSIVRTSKWDYKNRKYIPESTIQKSNLFKNEESYEIEIELDNNLAKQYKNAAQLKKKLNQGIKLVLSGLQQTNFPISYTEQKAVLYNFVKMTSNSTNQSLFANDKKGHNMRKNRKNFIGPSSITLEMENAAPNIDDLNIPNIHGAYTVTDKADGIRKLLYIGQKGKIYMIDINMNVQYTGLLTKDNKFYNSVLDGEHIIHDKNGKYLNLYMCFDIYFKNKDDLRYFPLIYRDNLSFDDKKYNTGVSRLEELTKFVKQMDILSIVKDKKPTMDIKVKTFYSNITSKNEKISIFKSCGSLLELMKDNLFDYETDGLIFTPIDKSVGSDKLGVLEHQKTWKHSFKWKPPEFNTIDFLVTTKKSETGKDIIKHLFQEGNDMGKSKNNLVQYKTIELRVGFNPKQHGFINPCQDVIDGNYPSSVDYDDREYKPVPFFPSEPSPNFNVHLCHIPLINGNMFIEDNTETFEDKTIVEFKYVKENDKYHQWIPIRVRHDKTADYRSGNRNFGNAYHVANGVWKSIHNPITSEMLSGKDGFDLENSEVYYKQSARKTTTRGLRDFHNKFVKTILIKNAAKNKETLIDMSVGRGGDLFKWHQSNLEFVLGIDLSKMNLENRKDGACARYLKYKSKHRKAPTCLFINGNSGLNLRNGSGIIDAKGKQLMSAIIGKGSKDKGVLGKVAYDNYGIGSEGFDVVSNMFSTHYFFEDVEILNEYLKNVSENCKINGYFIGTCYDGNKVFNMLKNKEFGESEYIIENNEKVWEIKKMYSNSSFPSDMNGVGLRVDVYQESINKMFPEYLVNFDYFKEVLELYGFEMIDGDECKEFGIFTGVDSFQRLFNKMKNDIENREMHVKKIGEALNMTDYEKKVSFLNNYFIFKKVRNVDASNVFKVQLDKANDVLDKNKEKIRKMKDNLRVVKRNVVKLKRKITLV